MIFFECCNLLTNISYAFKFRNLKIIPKVFKMIRNWHIFILDFFSLLPKKRTTYRLKNGLKFIVRSNTTDRGVITIVYLNDEYRIRQLALPDDAVIIDIGANIGIFSIYVASCAKRIFSYEPVSENFHLLAENIRINNLGNKIIPFQYAVVGNPGSKTRIYVSNINLGGHSIYNRHNGLFEDVNSITLQDIFEGNQIEQCELLKIDAEGAEYEILYALPDRYFQRTKRIYVEYHDKYIQDFIKEEKSYSYRQLKLFLEDKGYSVSEALDYLFAIRP